MTSWPVWSLIRISKGRSGPQQFREQQSESIKQCIMFDIQHTSKNCRFSKHSWIKLNFKRGKKEGFFYSAPGKILVIRILFIHKMAKLRGRNSVNTFIMQPIFVIFRKQLIFCRQISVYFREILILFADFRKNYAGYFIRNGYYFFFLLSSFLARCHLHFQAKMYFLLSNF